MSFFDRVVVQAIRATVAVQSFLLIFDSGWWVQRAACLRYCEHGWGRRVQWLVLDLHPVSFHHYLQAFEGLR